MAIFNASSSSSILLFLLLLVSTSSSQSRCHKDDANTLLKLKQSMGDPSRLWNWDASTDCCEWLGILCDADANGRVTFIMVRFSDAPATIPPLISRLEKLKTLIISNNAQLTGTIPRSIGKLTHLVSVDISQNPSLAGPIPDSLCGLPRLLDLRLNQNSLDGSVPACLGRNLTYIDLSSNRLTGSIPRSFMSRRSTDAPLSLKLDNNSLAGVIPPSLGDVPLDFIDLSTNRFVDASALFGEEKRIARMYMAHNKLAFDLSNVRLPLMLESLTMDHNELTGRIPRQIRKLKKLSLFDVSYNKLCGPIPAGPYSKFVTADSFAQNKCLCGAPLEPCS